MMLMDLLPTNGDDTLCKLILGTAAWGRRPYGINADHPEPRTIRGIIRAAASCGCRYYHTKNEYGIDENVEYMLAESGLSPISCTSTYGLEDARKAAALNPKGPLMVEYNPLRQFVVRGLGDYTGTLLVRSIFMQGALLRPELPEGATALRSWVTDRSGPNGELLNFISRSSPGGMMKTTFDMVYTLCVVMAFGNPLIDGVCVGINSMLEIHQLANICDTLKMVFFVDDDVSRFCMGDTRLTDPRTWTTKEGQ